MNNKLSKEQIEEYKKQIDKLDQIAMARLRRFAPAGHVYFTNQLYLYFENRFQELGGMEPEVSRLIGYEE